MGKCFNTEYVGTFDVSSHCNVCVQCRRLTLLSSYTTTRFLTVFGMPLFPITRRRILDECPKCGARGITAARKYAKEKKKNLALMMEGFASKADNPSNCSHALHTLMIYNEASWFHDVHKSYGLRFETHPQIQYLIAQGLCRFGEYDHAIEHSRKAVVLGAGKPAETLISFCQNLMDNKGQFDDLQIKPESARTAYIPLAAIAASLTLFAMIQGISALRTHTAWLVNGSLQQYTFTLDKVAYTIPPGNRQKIKMKIGKHELQIEDSLPQHFSYKSSKIRQLFQKELLVINPDAMALLTVDNKPEPYHAYGKQIHTLAGVGYPLFRKSTQEDALHVGKKVSFYRPDSHQALVNRFLDLGLTNAASAYARKALAADPGTKEAAELLEVGLNGYDSQFINKFLKRRLATTPALLPWHLYYQNHVMCTQSEHTLIEEYTDRLKENPDEPEAGYLLGRVIEDPAAARKFFLFSERGKGMNGLGYHTISDDLYYRGSFKSSLSFSKKALEKDPYNPQFKKRHEQNLMALRKYDELVQQGSRLLDYTEEKQILYLTCAGYHQEAEAAISKFSKASAKRHSELDAIRYYAVGNLADFTRSTAETDDQTARFKRYMYDNNIQEANRVLTADENHLWSDHLVLYCGAKKAKEERIAQYHLKKATEEMTLNSLHYKRTRVMLESDHPPAIEDLKVLHIKASEKSLLCATLGFRFPEKNQEYNALAQAYNFTPAYPQLLVRKWTQQAARTTSSAQLVKSPAD